MDISDSYEQQPQPQQADPQQQQQPQQQLMQCETVYGPSMNGWNEAAPLISSGQAIPLPAPPISKTTQQPQQQAAILQSQPLQPSGGDIDIDSMLLQQFSCLGTTDHEDLINQFQFLMNNQMNKDSARFYLEMSNWNLQTAVGCYLDFCNFQTLPSMKIVHQDRISEFQHTWRLQNDGTADWPTGCYLTSPSQTRRIDVPALKPGDTCDILAQVMPTQLPASAIMWQLCTPNGWNVGEPLWMAPSGISDSQSELSNRMSQLLTSSDATNSETCPQVNVVISANME